ncbi:methyltransferase domain-containing protein (plasmid) [Crocosphaera watsonii WH 8501]|uniref:C-methyltransferase n=3 Tax=Crocosphaera watsonii TaxID=263511 RepID=Q4BX32_CROWT|nr:class I SAM-dependent methyltransferase [Crocosphaera watsonii]EAM48454.1 hypothetical protein CwatDRAFT_0605 [Crocosphaera watsonii WH 8501]
MNTEYYRRNTCRLCDSKNLELVVKPAATPPGDRYVSADDLNQVQKIYPLDVFFCRDCGLLQLLDVVSPNILYGNYIYTTSISLGLVEHFRQYAVNVIERFHPKPNSLVIDIGSNDGTILRHFQALGMRVLGVEPATDIAQKATESGVETLATFFSPEVAQKIQYEYGKASIITANNVFANIDDLSTLIESIRSLLSPNGVFVMETGYGVDLIKNDVFDNIYHEHISYFNVKPLASFFRRHQMELIHVDHVETKGGSIRSFVQLQQDSPLVDESVKTMIQQEESLGFDRPEPYQTFANKIARVKIELIDLLTNLKSQGKTIAGYGASVGVTTLLYYLELSELLSFLVDDNPIRHNLFSPGHHIPVLPSDTLYEKKPDYVLILAWRYAEPIMKKHPKYLKQGGHFIQFLPEVKVI